MVCILGRQRNAISQYKDHIPKWARIWPCKTHVRVRFFKPCSLREGQNENKKECFQSSRSERKITEAYSVPEVPTPGVPHPFPLGLRLCSVKAKNKCLLGQSWSVIYISVWTNQQPSSSLEPPGKKVLEKVWWVVGSCGTFAGMWGSSEERLGRQRWPTCRDSSLGDSVPRAMLSCTYRAEGSTPAT